MRSRRSRANRRGAVAVEYALVLSLLFPLLFGTMVAGMGVFRQQEITHLAREAARWASVHGSQYATETGNAAATAADVYNTVIKPNLNALDASKLNYSVTWDADNSPYHTTVDSNNNSVKVGNTVTVTITYTWVPELYYTPVTLTSTSVAPMSY